MFSENGHNKEELMKVRNFEPEKQPVPAMHTAARAIQSAWF